MKVHLFNSDEPADFNKPVRVECGMVIDRPKHAFRIEGDLQQVQDLSTLGNCKKCVLANLDKRYMYGIGDGK